MKWKLNLFPVQNQPKSVHRVYEWSFALMTVLYPSRSIHLLYVTLLNPLKICLRCSGSISIPLSAMANIHSLISFSTDIWIFGGLDSLNLMVFRNQILENLNHLKRISQNNGKMIVSYNCITIFNRYGINLKNYVKYIF